MGAVTQKQLMQTVAAVEEMRAKLKQIGIQCTVEVSNSSWGTDSILLYGKTNVPDILPEGSKQVYPHGPELMYGVWHGVKIIY